MVVEDYMSEIQRQRVVWSRKAVLRKLYAGWYARCVECFAPIAPVVEVGAGCGNFKEFYPDAISTDVFVSGACVEAVMDANTLALKPDSVGNVFAFDVLHHLQRPLEFLRRGIVALKPGGRLVLCEPALSPWSRFVYKRFHHEPVDESWSPYAYDGTPAEEDLTHSFANMAIPESLLWTNRGKTLALFPDCSLLKAEKFAFLLYPLTGGFGYQAYVPAFGFAGLQWIEDFILKPFARWLTGMRMLVVLAKLDTRRVSAGGGTLT